MQIETRTSLTALLPQVDQTFGVYTMAARREAALTAECTRLETEVGVLGLTEAALTTLLSEVSRENLQQIEGTITYGLRAVFDDRLLTFKFVHGIARGAPTVEPVLVSRDGVEANPLDAFGGGPAAVAAFLLRVLVCVRLGLYPLIVADEVFSHVAEQYLPNLGQLLKELAGQMQLTLLLVSHQPTLLEYADHAYQVRDLPDGGITFEPV